MKPTAQHNSYFQVLFLSTLEIKTHIKPSQVPSLAMVIPGRSLSALSSIRCVRKGAVAIRYTWLRILRARCVIDVFGWRRVIIGD